MNYPYFGFQQPNIGQQLSQPTMLANPATQYTGAMPAGLGGVGASPISNVQQGVTPNMAGIMPLGMMGLNMMQQAHQAPGQQPNGGGLMGLAAAMTPSLMGGMPFSSPLAALMNGMIPGWSVGKGA